MNKDTLDNLIGGIPVSEQIGAALEHMATKNHTHPEYATIDEVEDLKKKIEMLLDLVVDASASE